MNNKEQFIVYVGLVIITVLGFIFAIQLFQALHPIQDIDPTPTLYVFPTAEQVASATPTSTASPEPTLTNTAQPTKTAVPTATVNIEATEQKRYTNDYLLAFDEVNNYLHTAKYNFDDKFGELIEGEVMPTNETWKKEVTDYLLIFDVYVLVMMGMEPPSDYEQAHNLIVEGINACSSGWFEMYNATQIADFDQYNDGIDQVRVCNQNWSQGENMIANLRR